MNEKKANRVYSQLLDKIIIPLLGNDTTYQGELEKVGIKLFGIKFKGVFPSDKIPPLNDLKSYAIINLDRSNQPGSHWVSVAHKDGKTYLYDSFGRDGKKILPSIYKSGNGIILNTDLDKEQHIKETNCGARSMAWLLFFDRYGHKNALLI